MLKKKSFEKIQKPYLQFLYFFKTYRCFFLFFLLVSRYRFKLFCRIRLLAQKTVVKKFAEIKTRKFHSCTVPKHCLNICTKTNPVPIGVHTTVNVWFLCTYCTYVHTNLYTVASAPFTWQAWFLCGDPDYFWPSAVKRFGTLYVLYVMCHKDTLKGYNVGRFVHPNLKG